MTHAEGIDVVDQTVHAQPYKLDQSYSSSRFCRTYADTSNLWENPSMVTTLDMDSIRASLQRLMTDRKIAPTTLSLRVGKGRTLVKEIMEGNGDIKLSTLNRLAEALGVHVDELLGREEEPTHLIALPVQMPSLDALTEMFEGLLMPLATAPDRTTAARALARSLPAALQAALSPHRVVELDEEREERRPSASEARPRH